MGFQDNHIAIAELHLAFMASTEPVIRRLLAVGWVFISVFCADPILMDDGTQFIQRRGREGIERRLLFVQPVTSPIVILTVNLYFGGCRKNLAKKVYPFFIGQVFRIIFQL